MHRTESEYDRGNGIQSPGLGAALHSGFGGTLAEQMNQAQGVAYGQAMDNQKARPTEPTMLGQATELLNHVATLEAHAASLRGVLFGEGDGDDPGKLPPSTLQGLLSDACQRVALLCGELATIKGKLGCDPIPAGL